MIAKYRIEVEQANRAEVVRRLIAEYEDELAEFMESAPKAPGRKAGSVSKLKKRPEAVCICTTQGGIVHANGQFLGITGYTMQELLGRNLSTLLVNNGDVQSLKEEIEYKGYLIEYRIRLLRKDGNMITCYINATIRWYNDENVPINQPLIKAWVRPARQ
ncbi:MAG: PAS domain-containing protein [Dehalococcoidia bacterium]|nr:PAS domain-containing protein [Dehalococcoidia bacterium]